jgi:hypothetical protein
LFYIYAYLNENPDLGIEYNKNHEGPFLQTFCDSDWAEYFYEQPYHLTSGYT